MENNSLGKKIAKLRKENNLTQKQLADLIHVTDKAISRWESGSGNPDISSLPQIAKVFGVPVDFLLNPLVDVEQTDNITNNAKKDIKMNPVFFYLFILEIIIISILASLLIYEYSRNYKSDTKINSNPYISNVTILLDHNDNDTLVDYEVLSNKSYYCSLSVCGTASITDFNFSSSTNNIRFSEIKHFRDEIFYSYIFIGDFEGKFTISFECANSTFFKTFCAIHGDISSDVLIDTDLNVELNPMPFIAEDEDDLSSYLDSNPSLKPYAYDLHNDFSNNILFFNYLYISPSEQKYSYLSSFIFNGKLYCDFSAKYFSSDIQFDVSGIHFSVIRLNRNYLNLAPFEIHFSYSDVL